MKYTSACTLPGVYFQLKSANEDFVNSINWLPLASVNIFIACFSLGFGPLPWMMMGEIFPPAIKEAACALAVTLNWLLVFTVIKTFDSVISVLGPEGAFWLFTVITSFGIVFICFVVKETKGKSFGEIQKMLGE